MLKVKDWSVSFRHRTGCKLLALDHINFSLQQGKTLGIVGESGSGKSVLARSLLGLLSSKTIKSGEIYWKNHPIHRYGRKELYKIRGAEIALVFQNPIDSLNPVYTIGQQMVETICLHRNVAKKEAKTIALDLLKRVWISDPEVRFNQYPHECSVGMCQRIMIAITVSMQPELLIADEITASLDVTVQAQILSLLEDLKREYAMSLIMISHDLGVIAQHCDYIMVLYLGRIVEYGGVLDIFERPHHPYTKALMESIPSIDPRIRSKKVPIIGEVPSPLNIPDGCHFHPRCPKIMTSCSIEQPLLECISDTHYSACFLEKGVSNDNKR